MMKNELILITMNYKLFELHENNRIVDETNPKFKSLMASMARDGWWTSEPMEVVRNSDGKYKITAGHHRFAAAKRLGIEVKYVIADKVIDPADRNDTVIVWTMKHYLDSNVQKGKDDYIALKEYHKRTQIGLMNCVAILGGQTAGTTSKNIPFKKGKFQLGNNSNAHAIEELVLCLKQHRVDFYNNSNLVKAVSRIVWVNGFSVKEMKKKISAHPYLITKRPTLNSYLDMFEEVYNRGRKDKTPLAFLANEVAKERQRLVLGPKNKTAKKGDLGGSRKGKRPAFWIQ